MSTNKVTFLPHNRKSTVQDGENILQAGMETGVHINASCGGKGVCGKCRVIIEEGKTEGGITEKLSQEDQEKGYRLACQSVVKGDLTVRIPVESEVDPNVLNIQTAPQRAAHFQEMNIEELKEKGLFMPPVEKKYLELPQPNAQDHLPDVTRLISYLKARHNEHRLVAELPVIRKIPAILREDDFKITATLARPVQKG
ncbi:MAG: 2Fe-2S iron-sulfur cluster binding domain-containing protein, partial [bacterium]|nr:2Fe-2S iron-sulfur cluster binding domain-containing protein [bacterium]